MVTREGLLALMERTRPFLEAIIKEFEMREGMGRPPGSPLTSGYCRGACAGLVKLLAVVDPSGLWRIGGGCGEECDPLPENSARFVSLSLFPGGMLDAHGGWNGHFWLEGVLDCGTSVIVDLTADQFGHGQVIVVDRSDLRYRRNILPTYEPLTEVERKWGEVLFLQVFDTLANQAFQVAA
jgi:hypothetical protein